MMRVSITAVFKRARARLAPLLRCYGEGAGGWGRKNALTLHSIGQALKKGALQSEGEANHLAFLHLAGACQ